MLLDCLLRVLIGFLSVILGFLICFLVYGFFQLLENKGKYINNFLGRNKEDSDKFFTDDMEE